MRVDASSGHSRPATAYATQPHTHSHKFPEAPSDFAALMPSASDGVALPYSRLTSSCVALPDAPPALQPSDKLLWCPP